MTALSERLQQPELLVAPGCYDALSALLVERAGFEAAYVSGASIAYTRFGRPDIGLVSFSEVADSVAAIRERVAIPLIVDIDTGFGNALNVQRTVKLLARAGASAMQLEDQVTPKRCGHLNDKQLDLDRRDGRQDQGGARREAGPRTCCWSRAPTRSRSKASTAALDRAEAYAEAGADVLFIEAPQSAERACRRSAGASPAESRCWPTWSRAARRRLTDAAELQALGFRSRSSRRHGARARACVLHDYFASLKAHGTTAPVPRPHARFQGHQRHRRHRRDAEASDAAMSEPRSGHAGRAQGPARADRRRDGRDAVPLGVQSDHRRGARRQPRALSRRRPATRWCRARRACRSSSARWRSRSGR